MGFFGFFPFSFFFFCCCIVGPNPLTARAKPEFMGGSPSGDPPRLFNENTYFLIQLGDRIFLLPPSLSSFTNAQLIFF